MKQNLVLIIIIGLLGCSCTTRNEANSTTELIETGSIKELVDNAENELSSKIVSKNVLRAFSSTKVNKDTTEIVRKLLSELNKELKSFSDNEYQIFDFIYEDFDGDTEKEILIHFGTTRFATQVMLLKEFRNRWSCIFNEEFGHHYSGVALEILEIVDGEKMFYVNHLEERGSGVHKTAFYFYRIVQREVVPVLRMLSTAYINGWGLLINQEINGNFKYNWIKDEVNIIYSYSFYPGPIYEGDASWESHSEIELLAGVEELVYKWDNLNKEYRLKQTSECVNNKIKTFDDFGNDSLFIIAFKPELDELAVSKDSIKSKIVKDYLSKIQSGEN